MTTNNFVVISSFRAVEYFKISIFTLTYKIERRASYTTNVTPDNIII